MQRLTGILLISLFLMAGCVRFSISTPLPSQTETQPLPTSIGAIYPWVDANPLMAGICFEAAQNAAGQVFVLRDSDAQTRFYDQADNSHLCRHPVTRYPFDFSNGGIVAGLWSAGHGCTARHDVLGVERDDAARRFTIHLRFVTEGSCDYELVRPFWIGLDGLAGYDIQIIVAILEQ
jgi:hypothetical protein